MKSKMSRRGFLSLSLTSISVFLVSCITRVKNPQKPTINNLSQSTNTPRPVFTNTLAATYTPAETPSPTQIPCFHLLAPENGVRLPIFGKVTFSWESMKGAEQYQLVLTLPSKQFITIEAVNTNYTRYIESLPLYGIYTWQVIAIDKNNAPICSTDSFTFEKPAIIQQNGTPTKAQSTNNNQNNGGQTLGETPTYPPPPPTETLGEG